MEGGGTLMAGLIAGCSGTAIAMRTVASGSGVPAHASPLASWKIHKVTRGSRTLNW